MTPYNLDGITPLPTDPSEPEQLQRAEVAEDLGLEDLGRQVGYFVAGADCLSLHYVKYFLRVFNHLALEYLNYNILKSLHTLWIV